MNAWTSNLLNQQPWLTHGTSTRAFGSLRYPNAGERDDPRAAARAAFVSSVGLDPTRLFFAGNVHGNAIRVPSVASEMIAGGTRVHDCDGLLTDEPGVSVAIKTADCLPIFFADPETRAVAIAHAGWKGVASGIAYEAVQAFVRCGTRPADLLAAIGPSIGPCHYSISDERRADMFARTPHVDPADLADGRADLRAIAVRQLLASGLVRTNIDASAPCTACKQEWFYSYHLTENAGDQMLSVIGIR